MSEHITHIGICEDALHLCLHSNDIHPDLVESIRAFPDLAIIASGSRGNHLFAVPFLEMIRDSTEEIEHQDKLLAAAVGWLTHRGADLKMKPLTEEENAVYNDPLFSNYENQIYQDAISFNKVYFDGNASSLSPYVHFSRATLEYRMDSHPGADFLDASEIEDLLVPLIQQHLFSIRAINRSSSNVEDWLDQFQDHYQDLSENLDNYIEAYTKPNPRKMERYIHSVNWYDENDPLIKLATAHKRNEESSISLQDALEQAEEQSQYARALRNAYRFVLKGSEFYEDRIPKEALYDFIDNNYEPHRI